MVVETPTGPVLVLPWWMEVKRPFTFGPNEVIEIGPKAEPDEPELVTTETPGLAAVRPCCGDGTEAV